MYNFKLTKVDLAAIVLCLRRTNLLSSTDSEEFLGVKKLVPGVISILLEQCFGEYNSELVWAYAMESDNNQFESLDELYEYLKDPYSNIVTTDSALTISQLMNIFPNEEMFKVFNEILPNKIC